MRKFIIQGKPITQDSLPFVIAEIGSNHGGDMDRAERLIRAAAECGCHAVKFQKRDNKNLYTKELYNKPYDNENSYGSTYGIHREALELSRNDHKQLKALSESLGLIYFSTPFDLQSVDDMESIDVQLYKVASADIKTIPLLKYIGRTARPVIISTGGATLEDIDRALEAIGHENVAILHCTASYPAQASQLNLLAIMTMLDRYKGNIIGLSDHYDGILSAIAASILGARIIEKHFYIPGCRGTDVAFSLDPHKMRDLTEDLMKIPLMIGNGEKGPMPEEVEPLRKMGKGIYASKEIKRGDIFTTSNLCFRSPSAGMGIEHWFRVIGKPSLQDISEETAITERMVGGERCLKM